ncbi:hypothetical protein QR680_017783 [Steinernema hermaphroditum]|uniref:4Fe-4S ferredoxin-type domain-containing protein n=1 Tax=Steinernema hermaphroditum TaxID=289476 RepID=A0AA39LQ02_9BILA|nr:hypothetical protein QR680_017783 [Steinernema hermaphroditum]
MKFVVFSIVLFFLLAVAFCGRQCNKNLPCPKNYFCGSSGKCIYIHQVLKRSTDQLTKEKCTKCADRCVNGACPSGFQCLSDDWCCKDCQ